MEVKGAPYWDIHIDGVLRAINDKEIGKITYTTEWNFTKLKEFEGMSIAEKLDKTRYHDVKCSGRGWEPLHKWNQNQDVNKKLILHRDDLEAPSLNLHKLKSVKLMISLQKCSHA